MLLYPPMRYQYLQPSGAEGELPAPELVDQIKVSKLLHQIPLKFGRTRPLFRLSTGIDMNHTRVHIFLRHHSTV